MNELIVDIVLHVSSFLDDNDMVALSAVCRYFRNTLTTNLGQRTIRVKTHATDDMIEQLVKCWGSSLININLNLCWEITYTPIAQLLMASCPLLQSVDFTNCVSLTDRTVAYLSTAPLRNIKFSGCNELTDESTRHLSIGATKKTLQCVDFSYCSLLSDDSIKFLAVCPLKSLDFSSCGKLTIDFIKYLSLSSAATTLEIVDFSFC